MAAQADNASTLHAGELEIRLGEGLVLATGRALTLSVREFELLAAMARRSGAIVAREELYSEVWKGELRAGDRSVDVYVSKLRGKLEAAMPDRRFIHTHPGFGYRFQPQPAREPNGVAHGAGEPIAQSPDSPMAQSPGDPMAHNTGDPDRDGDGGQPEARDDEHLHSSDRSRLLSQNVHIVAGSGQ